MGLQYPLGGFVFKQCLNDDYMSKFLFIHTARILTPSHGPKNTTQVHYKHIIFLSIFRALRTFPAGTVHDWSYDSKVNLATRAPLHKTCHYNGNFAFNGNYHGNKTPYPISINDSMEVTIKIQPTINGKFYAT